MCVNFGRDVYSVHWKRKRGKEDKKEGREKKSDCFITLRKKWQILYIVLLIYDIKEISKTMKFKNKLH